MSNCKSFLITEAERKHVRLRAPFQHRDASYQQVFFLQGKTPKEIHAILKEMLWEGSPSYATVKNWVAQFKLGDFSACDAPRLGRPKTVTTPEFIDKIHELILEDRRISAESIAVRKLPAKWIPKCLNADQKRQWCQSSFFFGAIQIISCRDW